MSKETIIFIDGVKYIIKEDFENKEKLVVLLAKMAAKIIKRGESKWFIVFIK